MSRSAAILRTLLPAMLGWFADAADPDAGLLSFRQVSDALGSTPWYLRVLRDEGVTAERLARLLATSRYVADLLARAPEAVALLADDAELRPRGLEALGGEMLAVARRNDDWEGAVAAARALRRRELLRIALRRPARPARRRRGRQRAVRRCRRHVGRRAGVGAAQGRGGARRAAAVATCDHRDGSARRARAGLRQRRRRAVRVRGTSMRTSGRRRLPRTMSPRSFVGCWRCPHRIRRCWSMPTCVRRAGRVRWCAALARTRSTTDAGPLPGRARRCCGQLRSPATSSSAGDSSS